jgi:hypothetical protein
VRNALVLTGTTVCSHAMSATARMLREAAEGAAVAWSGPMYPQAAERAHGPLHATIRRLCAAVGQLAAVGDQPSLLRCVRCLLQAWRRSATLPGVTDADTAAGCGEPGDVLFAAAGYLVSVWDQHPPGANSDVAELLGAIRALVKGTESLAASARPDTAAQLGGVQASLDAASEHLRSALPGVARPPPAQFPAAAETARLPPTIRAFGKGEDA